MIHTYMYISAYWVLAWAIYPPYNNWYIQVTQYPIPNTHKAKEPIFVWKLGRLLTYSPLILILDPWSLSHKKIWSIKKFDPWDTKKSLKKSFKKIWSLILDPWSLRHKKIWSLKKFDSWVTKKFDPDPWSLILETQKN